MANRPPNRVPRRIVVATSAQLASTGMSRYRVSGLVAQGRLLAVRRGVYALADVGAAGADGRAHALRVAAVLASCDFPVVASHRSAALIHGIDIIGKQTAEAVTVTRPPRGHGSRSLRTGVTVHSAALPAGHVVVKDGIRLTSVARTVVDLARACSFCDGVVAADSALHASKTTVPEINAVISDCSRWPGVQRARDVVAFSDHRPESALESIGRVVFHQHGLPAPELQVWVGGDLGIIGRADYLWPRHGTVAEADGAAKYANPGRAIAQLDRDARLRDAGFEVVHFTWQEITMSPGQVAARVRAALIRGARRQDAL
jgi:hypothetical protein